MKTNTYLVNLLVRGMMRYNTNVFITNAFSSASCMLANSDDLLWHLAAA